MTTYYTPTRRGDPLEQDAEGWWFWDETWADRYGPYPTKEIATEKLNAYARWLDGNDRAGWPEL